MELHRKNHGLRNEKVHFFQPRVHADMDVSLPKEFKMSTGWIASASHSLTMVEEMK